MPRNRRILGTLAVGIAFVATFLLVKEFKTSLFTSASMQEASDTASATAEQRLQDNATSTKSATETLIEKGRNDITATLDAAKTDKEKIVAASNFFFWSILSKHADPC